MYLDSLIVRRVPKWIRERTRENMEVYNMCLSDSFEEAVKSYPGLKKGSELWKAWYYNDFRLYIPSLTANNATREQLVWMVKDRESIIDMQQEQINRLQKQLEQWQAFCVDLVNHEAKPIMVEMPDSLKQTCDYLSAWTE